MKLQFAIFAVLVAFLFIGCSPKYTDEQIKACNSSDDCIMVPVIQTASDCCSCSEDMAINKNFVKYWYNKQQYKACGKIQCPFCMLNKVTRAVCENSVCMAKSD
jgi:hypothetical protein